MNLNNPYCSLNEVRLYSYHENYKKRILRCIFLIVILSSESMLLYSDILCNNDIFLYVNYTIVNQIILIETVD